MLEEAGLDRVGDKVKVARAGPVLTAAVGREADVEVNLAKAEVVAAKVAVVGEMVAVVAVAPAAGVVAAVAEFLACPEQEEAGEFRSSRFFTGKTCQMHRT